MFTGLVEAVGEVSEVESVADGLVLRVRAPGIAADLSLGESIAVDGVCQTVTAYDADRFAVQAVATTLQRTTLGTFRSGRRVNLERALPLGGRLGGHLVQGHVDGVGTVRSIASRGEHTLIDIEVPPDIAAVTVLHGSIAFNGVSLTVNAVPDLNVVQVSIIPHTWTHTALADLRAGDGVNVEGDMIGKYVRQLLGAPAQDRSAALPGSDLLRAWGY